MAEDVNNVVMEDEQFEDDTLGARFMDWVRTELVWYAGSFTVHLLGLSLLLLLGNFATNAVVGETVSLEEAKVDNSHEPDPPPMEKFDIGETPEEPTVLDTESLTLEKPAQMEQKEEYNDDSAVFEHKGGGMASTSKEPNVGGLGGFTITAYGPGPKVIGKGGVGIGVGTGTNPGSGGSGSGFGGRGSGHRKAMLASGGGTKQSERAVAGALHWLAFHQMPDGHWSLDYRKKCRDATCTGVGSSVADPGATAMGLLPFLAAGQTHKARGPYRKNIEYAIAWLCGQQGPDGNLAPHVGQPMYSHGLATIALCEAYGLTGDRNIGGHAQMAVNFVLAAQNKQTGGWRYNPGDPGDTSVVGWQTMALKSAHMAGLNIGGSSGTGSAFDGVSKWLDSCQKGPSNSLYSYTPVDGPSNTMSAVGLLCRQYLGAKKSDPLMVDGTKYLLANLPDPQLHNIYYWYYATQVMHNITGYEWDTWNRKMRKLLIDTQDRDMNCCSNGSWSPDTPSKDAWGANGGRLMLTALSALTLEIYYRYLPLYKTDAADAPAPAHAAEKADAKADPNEVPTAGDAKDAKAAKGAVKKAL